MKTEHQQRVEEFMEKAEQDVPSSPTIPTAEVRELRARLILEEALETIEALGFDVDEGSTGFLELNLAHEPDLAQIADGCADLSVVAIGTLSACGIKDQPLLEEVDRSNLSKFSEPSCPMCGRNLAYRHNRWWCDEEICTQSRTFTREEMGGYKDEHGKWIKPSDWEPPDIERVLNEQRNEEPITDEVIQRAFDTGWVLDRSMNLHKPGDESLRWCAEWSRHEVQAPLTQKTVTIHVPHWLPRRMRELEEERMDEITARKTTE